MKARRGPSRWAAAAGSHSPHARAGRASLLAFAFALAALGCGPALPEEHVRLESIAPSGTVPPGAVAVELHFTGPVSPDGVADGRRVALCRSADAAAVAAAAGSDEGLRPTDPALPARVELLGEGRAVRITPLRPLWPMAAWEVVVGKGLRDPDGQVVLDPAGRARTFRQAFTTGDLPPGALPALSLTEALSRAAAPDSAGEYAEISNRGDTPADLAGFRLAKRTASGAVQRCVLESAAGPVPPGGYAILTGGAWDGRYSLPPATSIYRCGSGALLGGLANDRPIALALESPGGALLSSLGWEAAGPLCASGALERIHPAGPDAPGNLACTGAMTPGACNSSTPAAECR